MKSIHLICLAGALAALPLANSCVNVSAVESLPDGVAVETSTGIVRLKVINDKIIRVSVTPEKGFPNDSSLVVVPVKNTAEFSVRSEEHTSELQSQR